MSTASNDLKAQFDAHMQSMDDWVAVALPPSHSASFTTKGASTNKTNTKSAVAKSSIIDVDNDTGIHDVVVHSKNTPSYQMNDNVLYFSSTTATPIPVTIVGVHADDIGNQFYTIQYPTESEKGTIAKYLSKNQPRIQTPRTSVTQVRKIRPITPGTTMVQNSNLM